MNTNIRFILAILATVALTVFALLPLPYWAAHPELTQMQIFLKWWWAYLATVILGVIIIRLTYGKT